MANQISDFQELLKFKEIALPLANKATNGTNDCCCDCAFWVGRCLKGKINRIAHSPACEDSAGLERCWKRVTPMT